MTRIQRIVTGAILAGLLGNSVSAQAAGVPISVDLSAIAFAGAGPLTLTADPLPSQVFSGKNVVIPLNITSGASKVNANSLRIEVLYQVADTAGAPMGPYASAPAAPFAGAPMALQIDPAQANTFRGTTVISRSSLPSMGHGGKYLRYYFRVVQGSSEFLLGSAANPFAVQFIDTLSAPVGSDAGSMVLPDTDETDGKTRVSFAAGALTGPGTLTIHQEDPAASPAGPGNVSPVVAYSLDLQGTSLQRTGDITLSYPANLDGTVTAGNTAFSSDKLAMYWLRQSQGWELLCQPSIDTTLHTVTCPTTHFSLFALFPSGQVSAADLRPKQRILTPNGDGANDTITFTGLGDGDRVVIFDIRGRRVRTLPGPSPTWDGSDDAGRTVESGVYVYQYTYQGSRVSGVISVAK